MTANATEPSTENATSRTLLGFAALAVIPAILVLDLSLALVQGWQSSSDVPNAVFGLFGAILVVALVLLGLPRGRAWLARRAPALVALILSLTIAWLGAEWVVGRAFGEKLMFHRHMPHTDARFQPTPEVMPGVHDEAKYTANSRGIRGPEFPNDDSYRVLCIGGSTTACLFLDDRETWTALIHDRCADAFPEGLWVGDVGKSGYGTWHHVRLLDDEELLEQIDCAVFLVGINDFMRGVQRRLIYAPPGVKPLYERSNIFAVLHNLYQIRKQRRHYMEEYSDGSSYVRRRELRASRELAADLPDLSGPLGEYRANIRALIERCRQHGVRPVFLTQPVLWDADLPPELDALLWLGELPDGRYLTAPALAEGMDLFNAALRDECEQAGVQCIDLSSMDGNGSYFFDDCHFTEAGAVEVAELVAAELRDRTPPSEVR